MKAIAIHAVVNSGLPHLGSWTGGVYLRLNPEVVQQILTVLKAEMYYATYTPVIVKEKP